MPTPSPLAGSVSRSPTLRPTVFSTNGPTSGPTLRPTTVCNQVDNPPQLIVEPGTNLTWTVTNRLVPSGCVLQTCAANVFDSVVAFFELLRTDSSPLLRLNVTTEDQSHGLTVGVVLAESLSLERGFCVDRVVDPVVPSQAQVVVNSPASISLRQFLVVAPSAASGSLPNGAQVQLNMVLELCGGVRVNAFDASAPVTTSVTFAAQSHTVPDSCPIRRCGSTFADGEVNLVVRIVGHGTNAIQPIIAGGTSFNMALLGSITDNSATCLRELFNGNPFVNNPVFNTNENFMVLSPGPGLTVIDGTPIELRLVAP